MNARDELQKVIFGYFGPTLAINAYKTPERQDRELADAILSAGYRRRRTITTAEELDALPEGSVILSVRTGDSAQMDHEGYWYWWGGDTGLTSTEIDLPAAVLHEPEPQS